MKNAKLLELVGHMLEAMEALRDGPAAEESFATSYREAVSLYTKLRAKEPSPSPRESGEGASEKVLTVSEVKAGWKRIGYTLSGEGPNLAWAYCDSCFKVAPSGWEPGGECVADCPGTFVRVVPDPPEEPAPGGDPSSIMRKHVKEWQAARAGHIDDLCGNYCAAMKVLPDECELVEHTEGTKVTWTIQRRTKEDVELARAGHSPADVAALVEAAATVYASLTFFEGPDYEARNVRDLKALDIYLRPFRKEQP